MTTNFNLLLPTAAILCSDTKPFTSSPSEAAEYARELSKHTLLSESWSKWVQGCGKPIRLEVR